MCHHFVVVVKNNNRGIDSYSTLAMKNREESKEQRSVKERLAPTVRQVGGAVSDVGTRGSSPDGAVRRTQR